MKLTAEEIRLLDAVRKLKSSSEEEQKEFIEQVSEISEEFAKELENYFDK